MQTLLDDYKVHTLRSFKHQDGATMVSLNDEWVMPMKRFHELGGIVALFHEPAVPAEFEWNGVSAPNGHGCCGFTPFK